MTDKRFTYDFKTVSILKDGEFWLDGQVATACNHSEICDELNALNDENEVLKQQINELKEDVPLLLAFYRWYPFAVEKKEHHSYNRLWDFVND